MNATMRYGKVRKGQRGCGIRGRRVGQRGLFGTAIRAADLGGSHCSSFFLSSDIVIGRLNLIEVYKL